MLLWICQLPSRVSLSTAKMRLEVPSTRLVVGSRGDEAWLGHPTGDKSTSLNKVTGK